MTQKIYSSEALDQIHAAKSLAEALPSVAHNNHNGNVQTSIENAIISLLAPFQPVDAVKAQPTSDRREDGEAGTASTTAPEGEVCPGCGEVHTPEQEARLDKLRSLLESIFGEGSVHVVSEPRIKH